MSSRHSPLPDAYILRIRQVWWQKNPAVTKRVRCPEILDRGAGSSERITNDVRHRRAGEQVILLRFPECLEIHATHLRMAAESCECRAIGRLPHERRANRADYQVAAAEITLDATYEIIGEGLDFVSGSNAGCHHRRVRTTGNSLEHA